jgi:hypothetical protein
MLKCSSLHSSKIVNPSNHEITGDLSELIFTNISFPANILSFGNLGSDLFSRHCDLVIINKE